MNANTDQTLNYTLEMIDRIKFIVSSDSVAELETNRPARLALERAYEIIAEACRRLPDNLKVKYTQIPWSELVDLGDLVFYDYAHVEVALLVKVSEVELPNLAQVCHLELAAGEHSK